MAKIMRLANRTAVVTGAAGGIGRAIWLVASDDQLGWGGIGERFPNHDDLPVGLNRDPFGAIAAAEVIRQLPVGLVAG